ncbi:mitochondrial glycoprotein [Fomitopsis serialis]|uniref:mitochondrial glycoprotein n=1 Tax=Fomitopsis serialis TaxID=139415 RepID=UPI002007B02D|nr:mitochondrial glycoprotein [Neoantrodia serialis]KAH9916057.1 mitochondrial glycoprotein [Neoantrodia serialis]
MFSIADIQNEQESEFEQGEEGEQTPEEQPIHSYPIRCSISITKAGADGAVNVDALCQEGAFLVDNISFYKDAAVGTELTAEADWKRRGLYIGPQFDTLDVTVQEEFEHWLRERGIDEELSTFIPEYSEFKEQKVRPVMAYVWQMLMAICFSVGVCRLAAARQEVHRGIDALLLRTACNSAGLLTQKLMQCLCCSPYLHDRPNRNVSLIMHFPLMHMRFFPAARSPMTGSHSCQCHPARGFD